MQLVIVSNRLPVSIKKTNGKIEVFPSVGGLATGLSSYTESKRNKWVGWPGIAREDLTEKEREHVAEELRHYNCYPVFLTHKQIDLFYGGYSNSVLWPTFHNSPISDETTAHIKEMWRAYKQVNAQFAEQVLALSEPGNNIWVHDYQLLLLPTLLRAERPQDTIGFFLHIPFPAVDEFGHIPQGRELLQGLLGADLIGFHTTSYTAHFLEIVEAYQLGIAQSGRVLLENRVVRVTDFPMGIDYEKYVRARKSKAVKAASARLRLKYRGKKIILTVDRLDPAKGLVERVEAFRTLLAKNPGLHGTVVMVMLVVPSRTDIKEYKELKQRLEKLVRDTNRQFRTLRWRPIEYNFKALPFAQVTALYHVADVAFIAPLRDGMNLVAKEYVASKETPHGVLVLSKTAGAAQELKNAIMVDPAEPASLVRGLKRAITMSQPELRKRVKHMQRHLAETTVQQWATTFVKTMGRANTPRMHTAHMIRPADQDFLAAAFSAARHSLLLLDYDGTLAPFKNNPEKARPSLELITLLDRLAEHKGVELVIISGRSKADLSAWFTNSALTLVAEHGAFIRKKGAKRWLQSVSTTDLDWKDIVAPVLEKYAAKTPGGFVEHKDAALVWHFRKASPYHAQKYLVHLKRALKSVSHDLDLSVRQGHMILEIKPREIHKGCVVPNLLIKQYDFMLAMGDDYTDEDTFSALPPHAHTIKVGRGQTAARYRVKNVSAALDLLTALARTLP